MDDLNSLPYLDTVVRETLRLHGPVAMLIREAKKDDVIPLSEPFTDRYGRVHKEIRCVLVSEYLWMCTKTDASFSFSQDRKGQQSRASDHCNSTVQRDLGRRCYGVQVSPGHLQSPSIPTLIGLCATNDHQFLQARAVAAAS